MLEWVRILEILHGFRDLLGFTHLAHVFYFAMGLGALYFQFLTIRRLRKTIADVDKRLYALDHPKGRVNLLSQLCDNQIKIQNEAMVEAAKAKQNADTILAIINKKSPQ